MDGGVVVSELGHSHLFACDWLHLLSVRLVYIAQTRRAFSYSFFVVVVVVFSCKAYVQANLHAMVQVASSSSI